MMNQKTRKKGFKLKKQQMVKYNKFNSSQSR